MSDQNQLPKIGLVTVLYNGKEVLTEFFESLARQTYKNYVLYVIDNSPNDEALDLAKILAVQYSIPAEFTKNSENMGVAKANNQGIKMSLGSGCEFVLLLNNDIDFKHTVIEKMVNYAVRCDQNIIVPKIYYAGTNKIWMAGGYFDKFRGITPHRGDMEEDKGQYDKIEVTEYAPTCFMLIKNSVWPKVGFMDESYFVYYDDSDWVWRAKNLGIFILYFPDVTINHKVSVSTGRGSLFAMYYANRNRVFFVVKNYGALNKFFSLTYFVITRAIKYFSYHKSERESLVKGLKDALKMIRETKL